jgi:hypothetical protein
MAVKPFTTPFNVSLSISHPEVEPDYVTEKLGLTPRLAERKGERLKRLPFLEGTRQAEILNRKSLWIHHFEPLSEEPLDACLQRLIAKLQSEPELLNWILTTGGRIGVTVYLYPMSGRDQPFDYERINEIRSLRVSFDMEYFPNEDYVKPG